MTAAAAPVANDPARRQWILEAYAGKERVHHSVCLGDVALDLAVKMLERRGGGLRIKAKPR